MEELELKLKGVSDIFKKHPALYSEALFASSKENLGISQIREVIYDLVVKK